MTGSDIQTKIFNFTLDHLEYFGKQDSVVLAAMVKEGIITQAELEQYKKIGLFGFGFGISEDIGLSVEQTTPRVSSAGVREETPSAPRVSPAEYSQVRDFALDQLYDNVDVALKTLEKYKKDFGYISFDAVDHGLRQIAFLKRGIGC